MVYYDEADLVISLLSWFILFLTLFIAGIYHPTEEDADPARMLQIQHFVLYAGSVLAAGFAIWSVWLSIKYNRSALIGIPYGIFRLLSGLIGVWILISQVFTMKDEKKPGIKIFGSLCLFSALSGGSGKKYTETKDGVCHDEHTGKAIYFI